MRLLLIALVTTLLALLSGQGFARARVVTGAWADPGASRAGSEIVEVSRRSPYRVAAHEIQVEPVEPRTAEYPVPAADERPRREVEVATPQRHPRPAPEREPRQWRGHLDPPPPRA